MFAEDLRQSLLINGVMGKLIPSAATHDSPRKRIEAHDQFLLDIPSHWEIVKLTNIGKIVGGGTPKSSVPAYWGDDVIWITPADMKGDEKWIESSGRRISYEGLQHSSARLLPKGSIIVSSRAPIGYVKIAASEMATSQGCKSIVFTSSVNVEYFYYVLLAFKARLNSLGSGTTFKEISGRVLGSLEVPLPPIEEQGEIAKQLDALLPIVDDLAALEREREDLDRLLHEQILLSVLKDLTFGQLTRHWREQHDIPELEFDFLGNVFQWTSGGTPARSRSEFYGGDIPWFKTGELRENRLYRSEETITEQAVSGSSAKIFPAGTVLVAMYGATLGRVAILGVAGCTNQACAAALPSDRMLPEYLVLLIVSLRTYLRSLAKGGAQPNISQTVLKQIQVPVPSIKEQKKIIELAHQLSLTSNDSFSLIHSSIFS